MDSTRLPAVILAGGRSTRMGGGDKALRLVAGRSLLQHVIDQLAPQCAPLALNANGDPARFTELGLHVLPDDLPDHPGPLAGILAGLDWAAGQGAPAIITAAADTPFLPSDLAARLIRAQGPSALAIAASIDPQGQLRDHPTFGLWPVSVRANLRAGLVAGQRRVRAFAQIYDPGRAIWDSDPVDPFFNINTPDDLLRAETMAHRP